MRARSPRPSTSTPSPCGPASGCSTTAPAMKITNLPEANKYLTREYRKGWELRHATLSRRHFLAQRRGAWRCARSRSAGLADRLPDVSRYAKALGKDFEGTLKQLAGIGYKTIEMCSPAGYERSGYGPLAKLKAAEITQTIQAAGLDCESCHFKFRELKESLDERIAFAKELGLKQMVCSTFGVRPEARHGGLVRAPRELNKIGEQYTRRGSSSVSTIMNFEFKKIDGVLIYDKLMSKLDPKLVKMQFQVSVISLGYEAAKYFTKYPGRFISIHLQDWSAAEKKHGGGRQGRRSTGRRLFAAAKKAGVKNYLRGTGSRAAQGELSVSAQPEGLTAANFG